MPPCANARLYRCTTQACPALHGLCVHGTQRHPTPPTPHHAIAPLVVGLGGRVGAAYMSANAAGGNGRDAQVYMSARVDVCGRVDPYACRSARKCMWTCLHASSATRENMSARAHAASPHKDECARVHVYMSARAHGYVWSPGSGGVRASTCVQYRCKNLLK